MLLSSDMDAPSSFLALRVRLSGLLIRVPCRVRASQGALVAKSPSANAGEVRDAGWTPGSGRSPGGGNGNPLQCSC